MEQTTLEKELTLKMKEKFQKCDYRYSGGIPCGAQFNSPIGLVKHLRAAHGAPETYSPLIAAVVELKGPEFRSLDGEHVFMKLASYKKDRYCILHVVEYKFWVRAWATEADPSIDPADTVPIKITVPAPDLDGNKQHDQLYQFTGKILPYGTHTFNSEGPVEYFDVPKTFLRQYYERRAGGRFGVRFLFAMGTFDAKDVFKEDDKKMKVLQISDEGVKEGPVREAPGGGHGQEIEAVAISGNATSGLPLVKDDDDDDDDDKVIMRPFYEIYE